MSLNAKHWSKYLTSLAERLDMDGSTGGKVNVVVGDARALRDCAAFLVAPPKESRVLSDKPGGAEPFFRDHTGIVWELAEAKRVAALEEDVARLTLLMSRMQSALGTEDGS